MITIKNLKINIEKTGTGDKNIILLHGWDQSTKAFFEVARYLQDRFTVFNIDLPGFGLSDKPKYAFNTEDYAVILKEVVDYFSIKNPIIIGHSFGGRVAIKYASHNDNVSKLVLVDSAGIVNKKPFSYYLRVYTFKTMKKIFSLPILRKYKNTVLNKYGSTDYKNADEIMKKILVKVVNEDLRYEMENIKSPTLLVWGSNDDVTPINDAYIMKNHLNDAGIVKIENTGHFSYLENLNLFLCVLDAFFKEECENGGS